MMMFLFVLPAVAFVSCGDDDKDEGKDEPGATTSILGKYYDVDYPTDYIELKSGGVAVYYIDDEGKVDTETGSYVYNEPNISINFYGEVASGTISGNTMNLGEYGTFKKR